MRYIGEEKEKEGLFDRGKRFFLEKKHALEDGGERDSLIKGGKAQKSEKGAIATEFVQVCFLLLLEFLLIFDFSVCSFLNI